MNVAEAYGACQRVVRQKARNFAYGIRLLPLPKRQALSAVYAFSRLADDAVDELHGAQARRELDRVRRLLDQAYGSAFSASSEAVVVALGDAIRRYHLSRDAFEDLLAGMEMDLHPRRLGTWEEVEHYCVLVAGSVGRLSVEVFGYSRPRALPLAVELGMALQLTNILRDVGEDAARGRVYLPQELLLAHGVEDADLRASRVGPALREVLAAVARRAQAHYARAQPLYALVDEDARLCPLALSGIYHGLLEEMERRDLEVLAQRVSLPTRRKLEIVGALLWQRRSMAGPA